MIGLLIAILHAYEFIIIATALLSWTGLNPRNPLFHFLLGLTDPVLRRIRPWTVVGNVDLSPIVAIVGIEIVLFIVRGLY